MNNNEFLKSGPAHWTSRCNNYTISVVATLGVSTRRYILKDGHGTLLGNFNSKAAAIIAAREDSILKGC